MRETNYEVRVGLFALFALIALVWGWSWLKSFSLFNQPQRFIARFSDVAGLSRNAPVNIQGVRVGTAEDITFTPDKKVDVHLKITAESIRVPQGSTVTIQTLGLVGAKYLEVTLPEVPEGQQFPPPIADGTVVAGMDPVRIELMMNSVATRINDIVAHIDTQAAGQALNNLSEASQKLNKNVDKLARAGESVEAASRDISATSQRFGRTAESATVASQRATVFFEQGNTTFATINRLATDLRGTSGRVNRMLEDPKFSTDLKETVTQARITAQTIQTTLRDFSTTLQDRQLRDEVIAILTKLQQSTENIKFSMDVVNKLGSDQELRADVRDAVRTAREAMDKANQLLSEPGFRTDVRSTINKVRSAADNVDYAARQIKQVLNKRAPLLQLLFGRPGKLDPKEQQKEQIKDQLRNRQSQQQNQSNPANPQACPPGTVPIQQESPVILRPAPGTNQ